MRVLRGVLAVALGVAPVGAWAQAPAACSADDPITAEVNAREGSALAKDGQFEQAAALFGIAERLDPCTARYPWLLGIAFERMARWDDAQAAYARVVAQFPQSVEAVKAQGALAKLAVARAEAEERAAAAAAEARQQEEERRRQAEAERLRKLEAERLRKLEAERLRLIEVERLRSGQSAAPSDAGVSWVAVGAVTLGVGVLATGLGVGGALAAQNADEEVAKAALSGDRARYDALVIDRDDYTLMSYVGYGIGGALIVGGLVLMLIPDDDEAADEAVGAAVVPTADGAMMGLWGRF